MKRIVQSSLTLCLLSASTAAMAGQAPPDIKCDSAARDPNIPYAEYARAYYEACVPKRPSYAPPAAGATVAPIPSVADAKANWEAANFDGVPTWSDADIMEQFAATRDAVYLTDRQYSEVPVRRISWLYPDDGCFARAEQVNVRVTRAGKAKPYKLWAFGNLAVPSVNAYPGDTIYWGWHVVPLVKNQAGEPIVFDAALSPCKPLPYKTWLGMMVGGDLSQYNQTIPGETWRAWGVTVSDPYAYMTGDPVYGDSANAEAHELRSIEHEEGYYLSREWERQHDELQRNAELLLGTAPPWTGNACIFTEVFYKSADIAAGSSVSTTATCPFATLNVGGGFMSSDPALLISKNARLNNGWEIAAKNTSSTMKALTASAVCLTGAPRNASVSTVTGAAVSIANNAYNSSTASCSSGVLVGGGYSTTVAGTPSSIMKIYTDGRTNSTSNTWQVSAINRTGGNRSVTSYAYCLNNTSFSASQTSGMLSPEGISMASCPTPRFTMGGGFFFPRTSSYTVATMGNDGTVYAVDMLPPPSSSDSTSGAYAQCLSESTPPPACTEATATDLGTGQTPISVRGDGCVKITRYPGSWVGSVVLQSQGNGSGYPIPFTWTNCTSSGSGSISGDWSQSTLRPVKNTCTTLIDLNGSSSSRVTLAWWGNG